MQLDATILSKLNEAHALLAADADDVKSAIIKLQKTGKLPASLTQGTVDAMTKSLRKYFNKISADKIDEFTAKARSVVEATLKTEQETREGQTGTTTVGTGTADGRTELTSFLEEASGKGVADLMNMDFFQRIARQVAQGAGKLVAMNLDPVRVDEFPAMELLRVYDREVPRGEKRVKGVIVPDEENSWQERWKAACDDSGDEDAASAFEATGRMVALKSSDVWQSLGDGAGDYDDTLGNAFPPFAFQSGMDWDEVSRADATELGLIDEGAEAQGADLDFDELIALPTEAKVAFSLRHRLLHGIAAELMEALQ